MHLVADWLTSTQIQYIEIQYRLGAYKLKRMGKGDYVFQQGII